MTHIPAQLRKLVMLRALNHCEYCHLAQEGQEATFHIDHVIPVAADGETTLDNLALSCVSCSLYKGAKVKAKDPRSKRMVNLFSPRHDVWVNHFSWVDVELVGLTAVGRATVHQLKMNRSAVLSIRRVSKILGLHPW